MLDRANIWMHEGNDIAIEQLSGVNDNMNTSHYHEFYELYYLESGERYHLLDEQLYKLSPGQLIIFEPYQLHYSYGDQNIPFSRIVLYFKEPTLPFEDGTTILKGISGVYQLEKDENAELYQLLHKLVKEQDAKQPYYEVNRKSLLNQLLILLLRTKAPKKEVYSNTRISQVISYINQNYYNKLSTDHLAKEFYISKWHLCREFKSFTQTTIVQYVNNIRIIHAQQLLIKGEKNITTISSEIGFDSVTHFERVFKQITGMTPSQYKRQLPK